MPERLLQLDDLRNLTDHAKIASLFRRLGYDAEAQPLDIEDLQLTSRNAEATLEVYLIADQGNGGLQVLLFQLHPDEWLSPSTASNRMKALAAQVGRRQTEFLLLATKDYNQLMLVNPRKSFDDKMNLKASIRKLLIDRTNPTAYDLDRLEAIAVRGQPPQELYNTQCEAFDVEKLTKSFYRGYKHLFDKVQQVVKRHNDHPYFEDSDRLHQFSQRLLGRLMFLYFLQKKEFLAGDRRFLSTQYQRLRPDPDEMDYYGTVLEPLFFDTLNQQRPNLESKWGKIPYLNGGLFDRDYGIGIQDAAGRLTPDKIELPNSLFDPGDTDSILGFFNSYNFTIAENVAGDEDVAVDPEMLGKVFENMLAAEERGQSGTFYTPRGIVQFMCSEVLARYLVDETGMELEMVRGLLDYDPDLSDSAFNQLMTPQQARSLKLALASIKVLDPAVGSGAFPLGMMQVILNVRQAIARREGIKVSRGSLTISQWKRDIIANNLYGVDIKPEAIEIAKLRMWLSLVVDIPNIEDVEPLPNLDYKLMCGDSLICTIHGEQLIPDPTKTQQVMLAVTPIQQAIQPLLDLQHRYFDAQTEERHQLRQQILEAEANVFRVAVSDRCTYWSRKRKELEAKIKAMGGKVSKAQEKERAEITAKLSELNRFADEVASGDRSLNFFQYHLHFRDVFESKGGFDCVIGNPPYGADLDEEKKKILKEKYDYLVERMRNSYLYFMGLGHEILHNKGILSYIIPNEFLFQIYMAKARNFFLSHSQILYSINFGENVFKAIVPTCVISLKKVKQKNYKIAILDIRNNKTDNLFNDLQTSKFNYAINTDITNFPNATFSFEQNKSSIIVKLTKKLTQFESYVQTISYGITTGYDKLYIVDMQLANQLNFELDYLKPCLKGGQFNRYLCPDKAEKYVLYINNAFDLKKGKNIYSYLLSNKESIIKNCGEKQQGIRDWYILFRSRSPELFDTPKIMIRQTGDRIIATLDNEIGFYCIDSVICIPLKKEYRNYSCFLLGILNSNIMNFVYREISQERGRVLAQVKPKRIKSLPIPTASEGDRLAIEALVQKCLDAKGVGVEEWEAEIDDRVAHLYGLTAEEMKIIKGE